MSNLIIRHDLYLEVLKYGFKTTPLTLLYGQHSHLVHFVLSFFSLIRLCDPLSSQGSLRKEFPQNIGGSDVCYFCQRRVYVMERLSAEGKFFHRSCFTCDYCGTTLRLSSYAFDVEKGMTLQIPFNPCSFVNGVVSDAIYLFILNLFRSRTK